MRISTYLDLQAHILTSFYQFPAILPDPCHHVLLIVGLGNAMMGSDNSINSNPASSPDSLPLLFRSGLFASGNITNNESSKPKSHASTFSQLTLHLITSCNLLLLLWFIHHLRLAFWCFLCSFTSFNFSVSDTQTKSNKGGSAAIFIIPRA